MTEMSEADARVAAANLRNAERLERFYSPENVVVLRGREDFLRRRAIMRVAEHVARRNAELLKRLA